MTRLGPQPLRLWVAGRPRQPLGPRARWQRPSVREAWPAEWKRSGPERACPGVGRHGPAWARAAPLGLGEAASLLVRPHRLGQRARSRPRVASDGRASLPPGHVGGRVRPRRRGRRTPAATVCTARGSLSPGREDTVALRLRPASSRTRRAHTGGKPALSLPSRRPASQQLSRQRPRCVAPLEGVPLGRGHTVPQPNPHEKQAKATVPAHAGRG